jgi:cation diffusion facilitator family transporter
MNNVQELYREGRRAASWGIAIGLGLAMIKLLGGWYGHSLALLSDAVHSITDAVLSGVLLGALILAQRPADREHPYGHSRVEAVVGQCIAFALILLSLVIAWEALSTLHERSPRPEAFTLGIAAGGACLQEGLYRYMSRVARRTGSGALMATSKDFRLDALSSLTVLAGVSLANWGGEAWQWADHAAALAVAGTILWVGCDLFWENTQELMDRQADPEVLEQVRREARATPGVLGVEKLRVRKAGLEYLVDIHIEVDPETTVRVGHAIAHAVKDRVVRRVVQPIRDVLVHIEPHGG